MSERPFSPKDPVLEKGFAVAAGVVLLLLVACIPLARALDSDVDGRRPMYEDRERLAWLVHQAQLNEVAEPEAMEIREGGRRKVGAETFAASQGVSLEVRLQGEEYCLRAADDQGDRTEWLCHSPSDPPALPSGDPLATAD